MEQVSTYVGIDVSKDRLDVHVVPSGKSFSLARDEDGVAALAVRLTRMKPVLAVLEATGGYEHMAAAALAGARVPVASRP